MCRTLTEKNKENITDGYHSFKELYGHRHALFIALAESHPEKSWKALKHNDGSIWYGWFIAGIELPTGMITYHLPKQYWYLLNVNELDTAPPWDGHSSKDVIMRLITTSTAFWQQRD